jgi:hypothetical protein
MYANVAVEMSMSARFPDVSVASLMFLYWSPTVGHSNDGLEPALPR